MGLSLIAGVGSVRPLPAAAIGGGVSGADMGASVARLTQGKNMLCTGSVVGDGWVLTARHCFNPSGAPATDPATVTVSVWRNGSASGDIYSSAIQLPIVYSTGSFQGTLENDEVLLRMATAMPSWVKTIPMASSWPALGTKLTEYGYGLTGRSGGKNSTTPTTLQKTPDGNVSRVDCWNANSSGTYQWTAGHLCTQQTSGAWPGDSGGPLLWWVNGYWQQVGTFSLYPKNNDKNQLWRAFWSPVDPTTRSWNRANVTGSIAPNTILSDAASGAKWLYLNDGYRHYIPNLDVYNCLVTTGSSNTPTPWQLRKIETIPDMVGAAGWATCTLPPPTSTPPTLFNEIAWGSPGSTVPLFSGGPGVNSNGATGPAARIPVGTVIQTNCRSYNLAIAPSNSGGWWYRIAAGGYTGYWTPASVYENGSGAWPATGGLWDPAVPVC